MHQLSHQHSAHTSMGHDAAMFFGVLCFMVAIAQFLMPQRTF